MENKKSKKSTPVSFAALTPFIERTIITPKEETISGRNWIQWGDKNSYPDYIASLFGTVTTLRTVILGVVDYVTGNGSAEVGWDRPGALINRHGQTLRSFVKETAKSVAQFGGAFWQLIPDRAGRLAELYVLRPEFVRISKEKDVFYYSEKWNKGFGDALTFGKWLGAFAQDDKENYLPAVYYLQQWGDNVYPEPLYAAAVKACEVERNIDEFHLGNIERGFMGSYIVSFNQGTPTDEIKREIERDFTRKFGGATNAGRIMFAYNPDKDHAVQLLKMEVSDYGEKYETLSKHCRQQIFTAFRANPNLFGIPTESLGFSQEEYESAFKLFNRTIVAPIQDAITEAWGICTGGTLTIDPFTLEGAEEASTTGDEAAIEKEGE